MYRGFASDYTLTPICDVQDLIDFMADFENFEPDMENVWDDGDDNESDDAGELSGSEDEENVWAEENEFGPNFGAPPFADDPQAIWDNDQTPSETEECLRSREMESYGIAQTPYIDTHLGLSGMTNEWSGSHLYGWEARTREKGAHLYTTLEEKLAIPEVDVLRPTDEAMNAERTPVNLLPDDTLRLVFDLLFPPADIVPVAGFYDKDNLGRLFLDTVLSALNVSRRWYHAIMDFRALWAAYVPAAKHDEIWHILMARAGNAHVRLSYCAGITPQLVNEQLHRASAIYVTDDHPWYLFSPVLAGKVLSNLELLVVKPHERYMPRTRLPSHSGEPLSLPRLRVMETSTPFAVTAPTLEEVGLSYHTGEQLATILQPGLRPTRLVINRPREVGPMDWTELVKRIDYSQLCMLRIRGLDAQSGRLNLSAERLELPCLNSLDATGPVSVKARGVYFVKVFNVLVMEMLFILEEMPTVALLYVRWSPSEVSFVGYPEPLHFTQLTHLSIAGDLSRDTLAFLVSIRAPALEELQVFSRMNPPPDHSVLRPVKDSVQNTLILQGENREALVARLQHSNRELRRGHYDHVCEALRHILYEAWIEPTLQEVRQAAQNLVSAITAAEDEAPISHGGVLLAEIAQAAMAVVVSNEYAFTGDTEQLKMEGVWGSNDKIDFEVKMRDRECLLRFSLRPSVNGWGIRDDLGDSLTYRVARMLFGLQVLRPRLLRITGEPLQNLSEVEGQEDVNMLREVLASYESVKEIHWDLEREWYAPRTLSKVLADPNVLPELQRMTVVTSASRRNSRNLFDGDQHEISYNTILITYATGYPATTTTVADWCKSKQTCWHLAGLIP
ncbi:hypothetical protein PENSPDRAFT_667847 [Peniophora sp. CONT]|nr:hypothetical protein PENSPDRAFT_667847 [Peniophora sp. CONT]